jgi:hypothetical protein
VGVSSNGFLIALAPPHRLWEETSPHYSWSGENRAACLSDEQTSQRAASRVDSCADGVATWHTVHFSSMNVVVNPIAILLKAQIYWPRPERLAHRTLHE